MKKSILVVMFGLLVSGVASAKHGNGGENDIVTRGSAAWFTYESAEHLARGLASNNTISQDNFTRAQVSLQSPTTARVDLQTSAGAVSDECVMYDHASHSGTILKKEVRCPKVPYYGDKFELTRGSDAWAVIEALEHSMRIAVVTDASVLTQVTGAESVLVSKDTLDVLLTLQGKRELKFRCLRQYYGQYDPSSLNCALQQ